MKKYDSVIAIDGPAGSGKSTIAKFFADRVKATYIDTGSMFRAIGYVLNHAKIDCDSHDDLAAFLEKLNFEYGVSDEILVRVNGEDLTATIREHHVSALASQYSQFPLVRTFLAKLQRSLVDSGLCVMEGRDIGTVIFPNAFLKVFLTASAEVRAQRRFDQLKEKNESVDMAELLEDIKHRDIADTQRAVAPLKQADDAILLDTSELTLEQVLKSLEELYKKHQERI